MKFSTYISFLIGLIVFSSCTERGVFSGVSVKLDNPEHSVTFVKDTTLSATFSEALGCYDMQIVNDTILVLQSQPVNENNCFFKAYSTNTLDYLGSFVRNGRGPGEMLSPHIANTVSSSEFLSVNDNMQGEAFLINVPKSISQDVVSVKDSIDLPERVLDWLPLSESSSVSLVLEEEEAVLRYSDRDRMDDFHFYKSLVGEQYVTHLSGFILGNGDSSTVAVALCFFPQLLYLDTQNRSSSSVALSKDYRKWKDVSRKQLSMDSVEYLTGAISSRDYIFMLYKGKSLAQMAEAPQNTVIQILDWEGNYLYEIKVEEDLSNIAVDERHGYLYCIEKNTNSIVRYDLSSLKL